MKNLTLYRGDNKEIWIRITRDWAVFNITWSTVVFEIQNQDYEVILTKTATLTNPSAWECSVEITDTESLAIELWKYKFFARISDTIGNIETFINWFIDVLNPIW